MKYLEFPASWSGKLKVDDTSRVGNIQQLCKALLNTNYPTFGKTSEQIIQTVMCFALMILLVFKTRQEEQNYNNQGDRSARFVVLDH